MGKMIATRAAYGEALVELARVNDRVVVLDADLAHATMTQTFKNAFPQRHFNAGIAEANMICMAGGMTSAGLIPFCSTFAIFGTGRVYEQIRNSIAYPGLNVKLAMTHAGISVGEDGGSHQCFEDIALMRVIPNMTVICPADAAETRAAVFAGAEIDGPVYLRLARMATPVLEGSASKPFVLGKANVLREGDDAAIFAYGLEVFEALRAAEALEKKGVSTAVINIHTIKPLDEECILRFADRGMKIVTAEDASVIGGLGEAAASVLVKHGKNVRFASVGVQDRFGQSGTPEELMDEYGLSAEKIAEVIENM